jgi:hypothetical protein
MENCKRWLRTLKSSPPEFLLGAQMRSTNRWVSFVTKLNRQTQEDRIRWQFTGDQPDLTNSDVQIYGPAYVADVDDSTLRLYTLKTWRETPEGQNYWDEGVVLEIQTSEEGDFVRIPRVSGLEDLYESVTYKANKVEEFRERFLKED